MKLFKKRFLKNFPAAIWFIGLLLLLKSCFWLFASPLVLEPFLGIKHAATMVPFFLLCFLVWAEKNKALETALGLTLADLLFFLIFFRTSFFIPFDIYPMDMSATFPLLYFILNFLIYCCCALIGYGINLLILATGLYALVREKTAITGH